MAGPSLAELNEIAAPIMSANKSLYLGPFLIAMFIDTLFCGMFIMQCGAYFSRFKDDSKLLKSTVAYTLFITIASTVFMWAWMYDLFVYNFGTYGMFLSMKYLSWFYLLDCMMIVVVQAFFGLRAWKLVKKNMFVGFLILFLELAELGGGVGIKVVFTQSGSLSYASQTRIPTYICAFCMVVADVIITSIILFFLWSNRGGNIRSTDDLLTRLFRVTFASQLPPTLLAIATTIVYSIKNDSPNAIPFVCIQGKVYGISLLHTLNMRETWRRPDVIQADTAGAIEFQQPAQSTAWKARITVETHQHMVADRTAATASKWHSQTNDVDDAKSIGTSSVELSTLGDTGLASHFEKQAPVDAIV